MDTGIQDLMRELGRHWTIGFHDKWYMTRSGYYTPTPEPDSATLALQQAEAGERKRECA